MYIILIGAHEASGEVCYDDHPGKSWLQIEYRETDGRNLSFFYVCFRKECIASDFQMNDRRNIDEREG